MSNLQNVLSAWLSEVGPATPIETLFKMAQLSSDLGVASSALSNEISTRVSALLPTDPFYQLFALTKISKAPTGGTDVGQLAEYPLGGPEKIRIGGRVYLEMGAIETDPADFDAAYWAQWQWQIGMSMPFDTDMTGVTVVGAASNGSRICAIGNVGATNYAFLSDDGGQTFERVALPLTVAPIALYFLANRFYAVSNTGQVLASVTGAAGTWTSVLTGGATHSISSLAANGNTVVAVGQKAANTPVIYRATDAVTFAEVVAPTFAGFYRGISYDATLNRWFCASSANGDLYISTNNGVAWTMVQAIGASSLTAIVRLNGGLYAVAQSSHVWRWSGTAWVALGTVATGLHADNSSFVFDGYLYVRSSVVATQVRRTSDFMTFETVFEAPIAAHKLLFHAGAAIVLPLAASVSVPLYTHWLLVVAGSVYRSTVMDHKKYVRIK